MRKATQCALRRIGANIEYWPCARRCALHILPFKSSQQFYGVSTTIIPVWQEINWGLERWRNLPKVTQLVSMRNGSLTQVSVTPEPMILTPRKHRDVKKIPNLYLTTHTPPQPSPLNSIIILIINICWTNFLTHIPKKALLFIVFHLFCNNNNRLWIANPLPFISLNYLYSLNTNKSSCL